MIAIFENNNVLINADYDQAIFTTNDFLPVNLESVSKYYILDEKSEVSFENKITLMKNELHSGDTLITKTLLNFSSSLYKALHIVADFSALKIRIIALIERFDSFSENGKSLIKSLAIMDAFQANSTSEQTYKRMPGIEKAKKEGKYKGKKSYSYKDYPLFTRLYKEYTSRIINKEEFAKRLGISRPTLDKLIFEYSKERR
ncbi:MAG: recombinase family protein [Erysipelotrichaceae bacterium]|nr:recombinase family protein [Erysipelotrichaceae bacterium]MBQ6493166.1 recombinase family protein [Erysipelotrichaceae bacterium]